MKKKAVFGKVYFAQLFDFDESLASEFKAECERQSEGMFKYMLYIKKFNSLEQFYLSGFSFEESEKGLSFWYSNFKYILEYEHSKQN